MINKFRLFTGKYFSVDVDITENAFDCLVVIDSRGSFISDWYFDDEMKIDDYMRLIFKLDAMPSDELCKTLADEFGYEAILEPSIEEAVELGRKYDDDYLNIIDKHFILYHE